jgi:hypothetical protein
MADYYFDPEQDVFQPIADLIELWTGFKSFYQESSRNHALQRFDWTPTTGVAKGPVNPGYANGPNGPLADIDFRADIECRGKTGAEAWRMLQILLTASRRTKFAAGQLESWSMEPSSNQASTLKTVVRATVSWSMPLLEIDLTNETTRVTFIAANFDTTSPPPNPGDLIAPGT